MVKYIVYNDDAVIDIVEADGMYVDSGVLFFIKRKPGTALVNYTFAAFKTWSSVVEKNG